MERENEMIVISHRLFYGREAEEESEEKAFIIPSKARGYLSFAEKNGREPHAGKLWLFP